MGKTSCTGFFVIWTFFWKEIRLNWNFLWNFFNKKCLISCISLKKRILNVCYTILQLNLILYCVKIFEEEKSLEMLVILFVHIRNVFTKQMKFPWKQTKTTKNGGYFFSILLMLLSFFICRKYSLTLFHISRFKV